VNSAALQRDDLVAVDFEDLDAVVADAAVVGAAVLPHHDPLIGRAEGQQVVLLARAWVAPRGPMKPRSHSCPGSSPSCYPAGPHQRRRHGPTRSPTVQRVGRGLSAVQTASTAPGLSSRNVREGAIFLCQRQPSSAGQTHGSAAFRSFPRVPHSAAKGSRPRRVSWQDWGPEVALRAARSYPSR
jgi:hypothetical protein